MATFEKPADPNSKKNQPDADPDADLIKTPSNKLKVCRKYQKIFKNIKKYEKVTKMSKNVKNEMNT